MLERPEAALALAAKLNINISKWVTGAQRRQIAAARGGASAGVPPAAVAAAAPTATSKKSRKAAAKRAGKRGKSVFVVHGRHTAVNKSMFAFLRALQLQPIEWDKARAMTGKPNPYIGETLDVAFNKASAVVVLMTPDDEARLKAEFRNDDDETFESELRGQPRPNVLFEAGFALAKYPDETVLVNIGKLRPFSDIQGKHILRLDNSASRRKELAQRLQSTGLEVDTDGSDWLNEGNFDVK